LENRWVFSRLRNVNNDSVGQLFRGVDPINRIDRPLSSRKILWREFPPPKKKAIDAKMFIFACESSK